MTAVMIDMPSSRLQSSDSQTSIGMDREKSVENISRQTTRLDGDLSLKEGIHFYPSTAVGRVGGCKDVDDCHEAEYQPYGLDPAAIFKKVKEDDTKFAPEQNITLFALRLALIEKSASGIGTLSFIWASTIILGGFASSINPIDFLVVTLILVTEGTRIFSRSRELEWQHLASKSTDSPLLYRSYVKNAQKQSSTVWAIDCKEEPPPRPVAANISRGGSRCSQGPETDNGGGSLQPTCLPSDGTRAATLDGEIKECSIHNISSPMPAQGKLQNVVRFEESVAMETSRDGTVPTVPPAKNIKRTWSAHLVPMLPGCLSCKFLSTRGISRMLYWVQVTSALICLVLSWWRLSKQDYDPPEVGRQDSPVNLYTSLNIFYTLALTEAALFLLERAYWEYKINFVQLLVQVNNKADLGNENQETIKQFFYEVYKKCIEGSVFDGLDMDLVEYSLTLLQSDNSYEQLGGLRVLRKIVDRFDGFSADALRRIGTAPGVIERLVEMLSWRSPHQEEIRTEVAALICQVVRYSKNCFKISAVPGAMEGIVSLLKRDARSVQRAIGPTTTTLQLDGLRILVALSADQVNLLKIGEARGLVPILVSFIAVKDIHSFQRMEGDVLKTFKKVLRLLSTLGAARNTCGTILRPVIARVVPCIPNLRDILEFGDCHPQLQWMVIEIFTNLALDNDIRRAIGSSGGIIRNLFTLYIKNFDGSEANENMKAEKAVSKRAGDVLNLLAIQDQKNCLRMMELQDRNGRRPFVPALIKLLDEHREQTICAAKILRSFMEYGNASQKREVAVCSPRVMSLVMGSASQKMQEAVIGLAPRVIAVVDDPTYSQIFETLDRQQLVQQLLRNLEHQSQTSSKFPRIRRHSVEFILALVKRDATFLEQFVWQGLETKLVHAMDTVCEAENFVIFSGTEGLARHSIMMESLIERALLDLQRLMEEKAFTDNGAQIPSYDM